MVGGGAVADAAAMSGESSRQKAAAARMGFESGNLMVKVL
jgi:hypothetical protein